MTDGAVGQADEVVEGPVEGSVERPTEETSTRPAPGPVEVQPVVPPLRTFYLELASQASRIADGLQAVADADQLEANRYGMSALANALQLQEQLVGCSMEVER